MANQTVCVPKPTKFNIMRRMKPPQTPISDLTEMVTGMAPELMPGEFVFCTFPDATYGQLAHYRPVASIIEGEGLTLVLPHQEALNADLPFDGRFRMLTLQVHSSLSAYGLTAVFATALAREKISANVVAGYFHDHLFVPVDQADAALGVLRRLAADPGPIIAKVMG